MKMKTRLETFIEIYEKMFLSCTMGNVGSQNLGGGMFKYLYYYLTNVVNIKIHRLNSSAKLHNAPLISNKD